MILGHGLGGTKEAGLGPIANNVASNGWAALVIDYRGFGQSNKIIGQPEGYFDVNYIAADYIAAVAWVRVHKSLNAKKVVLNGFSMGAHGAAIATLKLQQQGTPVQGLVMMAPRVVPELPVYPLGGMGFDSFTRIMYVGAKLLAGLVLSGVKIKQHGETPQDRLALMPDSYSGWAIMPDGHNNYLAIETILPMVWPSGEVRKLNQSFGSIKVPVLLFFGEHDVRLGSAPSRVRRLFDGKAGEPVEVKMYPGEHMSPLGMVNPRAYAAHKDTYIDPADTYVPAVHPQYIMPSMLAFLAKI